MAASVRLPLVFQVGDRDDYAWFDDLAAPDADRGCPLGSITDRVIAVGAPLPADAVTRAPALARATEEGPRTSSVVRVAANCVTRALVNR